jgi:hypothetical protein
MNPNRDGHFSHMHESSHHEVALPCKWGRDRIRHSAQSVSRLVKGIHRASNGCRPDVVYAGGYAYGSFWRIAEGEQRGLVEEGGRSKDIDRCIALYTILDCR